MFRLIESRKERRRQRGATLFSVTAHTAVIIAVVAATATGEQPPPVEPPVPPTIYRIPVDPAPASPSTPPSGPALPVPSPTTITVPPIDIPTELPPIDDPLPHDPVIGHSTDPSIGTPGPSTGSPFGGTRRDTTAAWAHQVDRPATPLGKSRVPRYPSLLQNVRQEGSVVAYFVVDTLGRVEPASFRAASSTHALFTESVRSAVLAMRFRPAEVAGHPVRQLVEQRFIFTLTP